MSLLVFLLLTTTTAFLNQKFSPWQQLRPSGQLAGSHPGQPHQPAFSVPPTNSAPEQAPWGEVRITDPGMDDASAQPERDRGMARPALVVGRFTYDAAEDHLRTEQFRSDRSLQREDVTLGRAEIVPLRSLFQLPWEDSV